MNNAMLARRDALFDLLDALISTGPVSSFAMLSQSDQFQRKWPSLYAAVEDGELDSDWLRSYLAQQVPQQGICVFPIDGSPWPRPRSRVLDDRQYVYQASSDVNGGTVTVGYPYSLLEWCVEASLQLVIADRCSPCAEHANRARSRCRANPSPGEYPFSLFWKRWTSLQRMASMGNAGFLRSVKGLRCGILARLRCDRVLYRPTPATDGQRGSSPECMENALPSKSRKPGAHPMK